MSSTEAFAALRTQIRKIQALGEKFVEESAPEIAVEMKRDIAKKIDANVGPDGKPWPAAKSGDSVLANAAKSVTTRVVGKSIILRIDGPEARHHLGTGKGRVKRPILPSGKIPDTAMRAIHKVLERRFRKITASE